MMHDPSHPGEVIKHDCIEASQLTVTDAADGLGVSRKALSELINCKSGVSPDIFGCGPSLVVSCTRRQTRPMLTGLSS
mgnify:CR=1 FL=1